jgi:hypothetical protein
MSPFKPSLEPPDLCPLFFFVPAGQGCVENEDHILSRCRKAITSYQCPVYTEQGHLACFVPPSLRQALMVP